jgi:PPK2 family polyphosphate:nucleotide phosphotransferase
MDFNRYRIKPGSTVRLDKYDTRDTGDLDDKEEGARLLEKRIEDLSDLQDILYASDSHAALVIIQGMDTCGKDGIVRHVMSGVNPQGLRVHSFKEPSSEELDHDYLWRSAKALPERGTIGVFNRSYYEEVLVVRVHPELLATQKLPTGIDRVQIWSERYDQINEFERYLERNGVHVVKFYLHLSKKEQKERLLARIETPEKNWKFSLRDVDEREHWDDYMSAYEEALTHTSTEHAPWYVIPADRKWFARLAVAEILARRLEELGLQYPEVTDEQRERLAEGKRRLEG